MACRKKRSAFLVSSASFLSLLVLEHYALKAFCIPQVCHRSKPNVTCQQLQINMVRGYEWGGGRSQK